MANTEKKDYIPPVVQVKDIHVEDGYSLSSDGDVTLFCGSEGVTDHRTIHFGGGGSNQGDGNIEGINWNGDIEF